MFGHALSLLATSLGSLLASCVSLSGGARDRFAAMYTCPPDRVNVTPRPELNRGSLTPQRPEPAPPPDVAADSERLRFWREQQQKAEAATAADALPCEVFEVTGCGQGQLFCCTHHDHYGNGGTSIDPTHATCEGCLDLPATERLLRERTSTHRYSQVP